MKIAAIVPVKTFASGKSRLKIEPDKKVELCKLMLKEVLQTIAITPSISKIVIVSKDDEVTSIVKGMQKTELIEDDEIGVNQAIAKADKHLIEKNYDASIVFPQDIPYIKTQDVDFLLKFQSPPNFAIVVPSRRFDGTNALMRMPIDLMETHYDEDSYKIHLATAKNHTLNSSLVFIKRIMWDIDNFEDIEFVVRQNEKPELTKKIIDIIN